jgi:hypothetical protein
MARLKLSRKTNEDIMRPNDGTAGEVLADGSILELVGDPVGTKQPRLLRWDGKNAIVGERFECDGKTYVPARLDSSVLKALRLPTRVVPIASTHELFTSVCTLFARFSDLPEQFTRLIAYFLFADWLSDRVWLAPFLSILAPPTTPSGTLMRLLSLVCRRPILLGELSPGGFRKLPMWLSPTLLLDIPEPRAPLQRLLRASSRRGTYVSSEGRPVDLYCPKVVCSQEPLRDPTLLGLALEVALPPTRRKLPILDLGMSEQIADEFQAKLLMYRLTNFHNAKAPVVDLSELGAPTQDLVRTLMACTIGDTELQSGVVPLLREQDQEIEADRLSAVSSVILEALLFACHDGDRATVQVAELAEITNTIMARRQSALILSPEMVGWELKGLGFRTEPVGSAGKGLRLLEDMRARIHKLAHAYGVWSVRGGPMGLCRHCEAFDEHHKGEARASASSQDIVA